MIVILGQWAYSALMTMGFEETAALLLFKSDSVRDFIVSAIAEAKAIGLPYSSESSSCNKSHVPEYQHFLFSKFSTEQSTLSG